MAYVVAWCRCTAKHPFNLAAECLIHMILVAQHVHTCAVLHCSEPYMTLKVLLGCCVLRCRLRACWFSGCADVVGLFMFGQSIPTRRGLHYLHLYSCVATFLPVLTRRHTHEGHALTCMHDVVILDQDLANWTATVAKCRPNTSQTPAEYLSTTRCTHSVASTPAYAALNCKLKPS